MSSCQENPVQAKEINTLANFGKVDTSETFSESSNASHLGPLEERFSGAR